MRTHYTARQTSTQDLQFDVSHKNSNNFFSNLVTSEHMLIISTGLWRLLSVLLRSSSMKHEMFKHNRKLSRCYHGFQYQMKTLCLVLSIVLLSYLVWESYKLKRNFHFRINFKCLELTTTASYEPLSLPQLRKEYIA